MLVDQISKSPSYRDKTPLELEDIFFQPETIEHYVSKLKGTFSLKEIEHYEKCFMGLFNRTYFEGLMGPPLARLK